MSNDLKPDSRDFDLDNIKPSGFVDSTTYKIAFAKLREVKIIVDKLITIASEIYLPPEILGSIRAFNSDILEFIRRIEEEEKGNPSDVALKKDNLIKEITEYHRDCFNIHRSESRKLLLYFSIAYTYYLNDNKYLKEFSDLNTILTDKLNEIQTVKNTLLSNDDLNKVKLIKNEAETILNELKIKTSEQTVSDYAGVFKSNAENYKESASKWLYAGIGISIGFVIYLILTTTLGFLPTEVFDANQNFVHYSYTNLATKILIIAVIIFLMSFSFKQYYINKHLHTLNLHRQNALNSYKLFTKSIVGNDTSSQNALMIQVAKAIYEAQSTGFLNEKGQNVNSGLVEITRLIGENSKP